MDVITEENKDYLTKLSKKMRVEIRGKDIGGLGQIKLNYWGLGQIKPIIDV